MSVMLTDAQIDALADCVAMLISLARKRRQQQPGAVSDDTQKGDSAPAIAASNQVQRDNSEAFYGMRR